MKKFLFLTLALASCMALSAKKIVKTIHVTPDNATIYVNGNEVGSGSYTITFDKHTDFVMLKFKAPGYMTRTVRLQKDNPKETIAYKLYEDEAMKESVGGSEGADMANKWMQIVCKKGMTEDKIWRRLMSVAVDNFETVEVRDKAAGWIKTAWKKTTFSSGQCVRTRLEVRIVNGGEDEELSYKVRLSSEINEDLSKCGGEECYVKYARVLRKYYDVLTDLQNSLGTSN
jgi:hypothetical protein